MPRRVLSTGVLIAILFASLYATAQPPFDPNVPPESKENTATITVQNVVIQEGQKTAQIPITISSEYPGQKISGIHLTLLVGTEQEQIPILDISSPEVFAESLWNAHPNPIQQITPLAPGMASYMQITWFEPLDVIAIPCDGVVCIVTVDTSRIDMGERRIVTDHMGRTSATVADETYTYRPIRLKHDAGMIKVVPRRPGVNLNQ